MQAEVAMIVECENEVELMMVVDVKKATDLLYLSW